MKSKKITFYLKSNVSIYTEVIALAAYPVLIVLNIIPFSLRFIAFGLVVFIVMIASIVLKMTTRELGLAKPRKEDLKEYFFLALLSIAVVVLLSKTLGPSQNTKSLWSLFLVALMISPPQEFVYRSYLMPRLAKIFKWKWLIIVIDALLFSLLHLPYGNSFVVLPITFLAGTMFAWVYMRKDNFYLVSILHIILNFAVTAWAAVFVFH
jgi:membrane protease YdiL (CAAX protease family)